MGVVTVHLNRLGPSATENVPAGNVLGRHIVPADAPASGGSGPAAGDDRLHGATRALLAGFVVFTALAVVSLLMLTGRTQTFFAWPILSRPNAMFLGAAYAAGFALSVLAVSRRRWSSVRIPVVTVTAFTLLTLIPTLLHKHRLNLMAESGTARLAAWLWLVVYVLVPIGGGIVIVRQERARRLQGRGRRKSERPMPRPLVAVLLVQGTAMAAAGSILYAGGAAMHQSMDLRRPGWPWAITPLTSMVIGAWLLSFAIAITLAVLGRDLARMLVPAVAYAAFGAFELVVLIAHRNAPGTSTGWWCAAVVLAASLVPAGVYGAVRSSSRA